MIEPTRAQREIAPEEVPPKDENGLPPSSFDDDGVDRSLIREFLSMSSAERLDVVDGYAQEIEELRAKVRSAPARP